MGQEFVIKSTSLENKINQLLPSQGGQQAGVDLSASTTIVPIVNLTETAEGSLLRQDLQTCVDFATTRTEVNNATNTVIINNTGFFKVEVVIRGANGIASLNINDGASSQFIRNYNFGTTQQLITDNFIVLLRAGDRLRGTSTAAGVFMDLFTRQVADLQGNLTNPLGFTP